MWKNCILNDWVQFWFNQLKTLFFVFFFNFEWNNSAWSINLSFFQRLLINRILILIAGTYWNHYNVYLVFVVSSDKSNIIQFDTSVNFNHTSKVGETMVWFEKCDFKLRKYHFNLRFLLDCKNNGVMPKSPHFKLANRHLKNSHVYKKCQTRELEEEINRSKRGLIPWKKIHRGFRKNYKEDFRF